MDQNSRSSFPWKRATPKRILIGEDDRHLGWMLRENIRSAGYQVDLVSNGEEVLEKLQEKHYDLCLLDIMMPRMDGITVSRKLRVSDRHTPILFLTARSLDVDVIEGFKAGADDYVTKPFNIDELLWRIKSLLRRASRPLEETMEVDAQIVLGDCSFRLEERLLRGPEAEVRLSNRESEIFTLLAIQKGKVVSRGELVMHVWNRHDEHTSKTLDVHLTHIRKALTVFPSIELENIHGIGYRLNVAEARVAP